MGDTGSLALGGAIATIAMILKNPFIVIIVGGIYVIEALSSLIQIVFLNYLVNVFLKWLLFITHLNYMAGMKPR